MAFQKWPILAPHSVNHDRLLLLLNHPQSPLLAQTAVLLMYVWKQATETYMILMLITERWETELFLKEAILVKQATSLRTLLTWLRRPGCHLHPAQIAALLVWSCLDLTWETRLLCQELVGPLRTQMEKSGFSTRMELACVWRQQRSYITQCLGVAPSKFILVKLTFVTLVSLFIFLMYIKWDCVIWVSLCLSSLISFYKFLDVSEIIFMLLLENQK